MTTKPQSPARRCGRRKGRRGRHKELGAASEAGMGKGTPRYLSTPKPSQTDVSSSSEREARQGKAHEVTERPVETPFGLAAAGAMTAAPKQERELSPSERAPTEARLGADFSDVRVSENSPVAAAFGANAMTYDDAIHIAPGRSATPDLMSHELTHVAQQRRFGSEAAQFDMSIGLTDEDTGLGEFDVSLETKQGIHNGTPMWGMEAFFDFFPHDYAPYSNRIGLSQTADAEETDEPGNPDWEWTGDEANRENTKNTEGSFVDTLHGQLPANRNTEPWYWQGLSGNPEDTSQLNHFGWNRAADDRESTSLYDFPRWPNPVEFEFETVAVGRDNQTVYGAVRWGFETDGTTGTSNEWIEVPTITSSDPSTRYQTEAFDEARQAFRDFYVHEPVIVYFGYDERVPTESELAKMDNVSAYMTENPDAQIRLTASADMRGGVGSYNRQLALDRMNAVHTHLLRLGIPEDRIVRDESGANASRAEGSQDPAHRATEGSYQANRRVTLTFENTMSTPP